MAQSIDDLSIYIEGSCKSATQSIRGLINSLKSLNSAISSIDSSNMARLSNSLFSVSNSLSYISRSGNASRVIKDIAVSMKEISATSGSVSEIAKKLDGVGSAGKNTKGDIDGMKSSLNSALQLPAVIKSEITGLQTTFNRFDIEPFNTQLEKTVELMEYFVDIKSRLLSGPQSSPRKLIGQENIFDSTYTDLDATRNAKASAENLNAKNQDLGDEDKNISYICKSIDTKKIKELKALLSDVGKEAKSLSGKLGKMLLNFSGMPNAVKLTSKALDKFRLSSNALTKSLVRTLKMLRLMLVRMALRAIIDNARQGLKNLIQYSGEFDASVSLLWNSVRQLGNAAASAVSPLINALAPAINQIIQLCIKAVNSVNQLISALTGKTTWTKAKTLSDDYAKSLEKGSSAAKELKKSVLGFDELNQLTDNKSSDTGMTDPGDMFEDAKVGDKWKNMADWLKGMWDKGNFLELGTKIGDKLLDALRSIPWDKIKAEARKLGSSLATLLNGIFRTIGLGYEIGKTLAEAFNTAFEFLNSFVHKLDWKALGRFVANVLNGLFENIDWPLVRDTVITGVKGVVDSINAFIERFNWNNISNTISNGINIVAEAIYEFFSGIDFKDLGERLGEQLRKTIEKIDWKMVGRAIGSVVQSAINFVKGFLGEQDFTTIKTAISDLFKGFFEEVNSEELADAIGVVITVALGKVLIQNGVKTAISTLGSKIASTLTAEISKSFLGVAGAIVTAIVTFFAGAEIGKKIGGFIFPDDAELYEHYSGIKGTLEMLKDTVVALWDLIKMNTEEQFEKVGAVIKSVFLLAKTNIEEFIGGVKEKFTEMKNDVVEKIEKIQDLFTPDKWTLDGVAEGIKKTFEGAIDIVKDLWNGMVDNINGDHSIMGHEFTIDLPRFATGGFPEDGLFMANHGEMVGKFSNGKTAVANNQQITDGIARAVYSAIMNANASSGGGSGQYINNTIQIDGETIARAVTRGQQSIDRRYSPTGAY